MRWVPSLRDLSYDERLKKLQMPSLAKRRERGDMIMLYKCVEGIEKIDINEYIIPGQSSLRGHSKKLYTGLTHCVFMWAIQHVARCENAQCE